ncbi:AEC family transporter [Clostridium sp. D2Q-11]|uniref:AEC family transporter n=1 Tax=Anaeromonas frigoriresistens TaxID=2683708 RepID=A0A942UVM9_9FIRM|nr:AEC family transporter [Anaeromonas frigoriresistens]MBS4539428.1 AEC family transporter [Anaeromonas frigoriresistens]
MPAIIENVISLFIIILVGVYGNKKNIITEEINKALINILIQIALPFMILSSFIYTYDDAIKSNVTKTFYYTIIAYVIMIITSYIMLLPIKNDKKIILHFANIFTNTGYVGFPILNSIYGPEGVIYGSIFNMFFVILLWTYGIILFKGSLERKKLKSELKKILLNPSIIAVCIGIIIMMFDLQLPNALLSSIKNIGSITGPLSMIIIGVILSNTKIKKYIGDWTLYYGVTIKLIIIPTIMYLFSLVIGVSSKPITTIIIMSALPAAAMTAILAESFNKEKEYAAVIVSVTTLLSLITLTILLKFIL